jgi:hypothetical protein
MNRVIFKGGFTDYKDNPGAGGKNWLADEKLDVGVFHCPSDTGYTGIGQDSVKNSRLSSYDHYGNSYSANPSWIIYVGQGGCQGQDCCYSNGPALRPLSRVPNPANTILFTEECGYLAWTARPEDPNASFDCGRAFGWDTENVARGWHGRDWFFNTAFTDAHADTIKMRGYASPHLSEYPEGNEDLDAAYQSWCQVIQRGEGWQRDTLPAPPVATNIPCGN